MYANDGEYFLVGDALSVIYRGSSFVAAQIPEEDQWRFNAIALSD